MLRPFVHFFRLVPEGTSVSPSLEDLPMPPVPVDYNFPKDQNLGIVFFLRTVPAYGSLVLKENSKDSKDIVLTQNWSFTANTGKAWSNLMRPPGVTLHENRLTLGSFRPVDYILTITIEGKLIQNVSFFVR